MLRATAFLPWLLLAALLPFSARLPVWTDELFTLEVLALPTGEMLSRLAADIHPPLYFLLAKGWTALPLPGDPVERMRWFSALWAAATALTFDRLWLRQYDARRRALALALLCLTPSVLLYGRMGRSYLMQCALTLAAAWTVKRALEAPDWKRIGGAAMGIASLLYTHYVPGLALWGALHAVAWGRIPIRRIAVLDVAVLASYAPWLLTLAGALGKWRAGAGFASGYAISGDTVLEHGIKLGYAGVSFAIGESFPAGAFLAVPLFAALLAAGVWSWSRSQPRLLTFFLIAAALGYAGVARWVSYPFVPARLLWLLPFAILAVVGGAGRRLWLAVPMLAAGVAGWYGYWTRSGFLNPGYAVPLDEIAVRVRAESPSGALVLSDRFNTDAVALQRVLGGGIPMALIEAGQEKELLARAANERQVWVVRNGRDISPGGLTARVERAVCAGRVRRDYRYLPLEAWQRAALSKIAGGDAPSHFYYLASCRAD